MSFPWLNSRSFSFPLEALLHHGINNCNLCGLPSSCVSRLSCFHCWMVFLFCSFLVREWGVPSSCSEGGFGGYFEANILGSELGWNRGLLHSQSLSELRQHRIIYITPGKTKTSHDTKRKVRECKATAKGRVATYEVRDHHHLVWSTGQGKEDKDVLGGTDSRACSSGCRQGQKLDAGGWGLNGREKMWAEPSFEKHGRGGENVFKEVSGKERIFFPLR